MTWTIKWLDNLQENRDRKIELLKRQLVSDIRDEKNLIKQRKKEAKINNTAYVADKKIEDSIKLKIANNQAARKKLKSLYFSDSTFQGLRMTLHSTIQLAQRLLDEESFEYVLTRKLNQDPLEVS